MKKRGTAPYLMLLLVAVVAVFAADIIYQLRGGGFTAKPLHNHVSLSQIAILLFCALFYFADRMKLFHLSLRLCFLSLFLVWARILFELQTGKFAVNTIESVLLVFAGVVLLGLTRHPVRMLEKKQLPSEASGH